MSRPDASLVPALMPQLPSDEMTRLNERVLERLQEEIARKGFSQRDLAEMLDWSQSRVAKLLTGRMAMTLDYLEGFCIVLQIRPTELVRDRGLEFCAEMTPGELRVHQILQQYPAAHEALMTLLHVRTSPPTRRSQPAKAVKAKLPR